MCARGVLSSPCARFFVSRAFFLSVARWRSGDRHLQGANIPISVGQDRLILPDGAQAIAIYRGAPACVDGRRGLKPRFHGLRAGVLFLPARFFCCLKQDGQDVQDVQDELQVREALNVYRHQQEQEAKVR